MQEEVEQKTFNIVVSTTKLTARTILNGLQFFQNKGETTMEFFNSAIEVLQTLVVALGAGLGVWGAINLLEGYGNDNPGSKSQGMKQFMAN